MPRRGKHQHSELLRQINLKAWSKAAEAKDAAGAPSQQIVSDSERYRPGSPLELLTLRNAWLKRLMVATLSTRYAEYNETVFRGLGLGNEDVSTVLARGRVGSN
jgi:hypothetical protein